MGSPLGTLKGTIRLKDQVTVIVVVLHVLSFCGPSFLLLYYPPLPSLLVRNVVLPCLQALWSTVTIVIRAKATTYEVKAHAGGPIFVVPENFSETNLVLFLAETLLGID